MAAKKPRPAAHNTSADTREAVDQFMAQLNHPLKKEIEELREIITTVDASIYAGVKWNSPSFRTGEYFATTNLRAKNGVGLILHLGAKVRKIPAGIAIDDPAELLKWLGKDRAMVEIADMAEIKAKKAAFQSVLRQWIRYV
jgi:hypothetical protein